MIAITTLSFLVLFPSSMVEGFGYHEEESKLNLFEGGWCLSDYSEEGADYEMYYIDCNVTDCSPYDENTCFDSCTANFSNTVAIDYGKDEESAFCYCQNDCRCQWSPNGNYSVATTLSSWPQESCCDPQASDEDYDAGLACCGYDDFGYEWGYCNGSMYEFYEYCANGDFDSCIAQAVTVPVIPDYYCYEKVDGTFWVMFCNDNFGNDWGTATDCNGTDFVVEYTLASGWQELWACQPDGESWWDER